MSSILLLALPLGSFHWYALLTHVSNVSNAFAKNLCVFAAADVEDQCVQSHK